MISLKAIIDTNSPTYIQYANCIKLFYNNFEPFMKYKDNDNIDWVAIYHDDLYDEIVVHCTDNDLSQSTMKNYIIAMMFIIKLYHGGKDNDVYKTYQAVIEDIKKNITSIENKNKLNKSELKKGGVIPFQLLLDKQKELQDDFDLDFKFNNFNNINSYKTNQDLLLISLYTLMPPVRNEIKDLLFTNTFPHHDDNNNYIVILNDNSIHIYYGSIKKKHDVLIIHDNEINENLKKIIKQSYTIYPRKSVFTSTINFPFYDTKQSIATITTRLRAIFKDTKYTVGTSMIRSSFITHHFANPRLSYEQQLNIARLMRTSVDVCRQYYYKIIDNDNDNDSNSDNDIKQKRSQYYKNNKNKIAQYNSDYYQNNKDELNDKNKEYRINNTYKETRRKLIYRLNIDPNYCSKCRQKTLDKYDVKLINGKYV